MLLTFLKESMTMNVCSTYTKDILVDFDLTTDQGELLFSLRLDHEKVYICIDYLRDITINMPLICAILN